MCPHASPIMLSRLTTQCSAFLAQSALPPAQQKIFLNRCVRGGCTSPGYILSQMWISVLQVSMRFWMSVEASTDRDCYVGSSRHNEGSLFFHKCRQFSCMQGRPIPTRRNDPDCCFWENSWHSSGSSFSADCRQMMCQDGHITLHHHNSSQCCRFKNETLQHGEEVALQCGLLRCHAGRMLGTRRTLVTCGMCHIQPGVNLFTFEGRSLAFESKCAYNLLQTASGLSIAAEFGQCSSSFYTNKLSCVTLVTVYEPGQPTVTLHTGISNDSYSVRGEVWRAGPEVRYHDHSLVWAVEAGTRLVTRSNIMIESRSGSIAVWVPLELQGTIEGLCGKYTTTRNPLTSIVKETPISYHSNSQEDGDPKLAENGTVVSEGMQRFTMNNCTDNINQKDVCSRSFLFASNHVTACSAIVREQLNFGNCQGLVSATQYWMDVCRDLLCGCRAEFTNTCLGFVHDVIKNYATTHCMALKGPGCRWDGNVLPEGFRVYRGCQEYLCRGGRLRRTGNSHPSCCNSGGVFRDDESLWYESCFKFRCTNGSSVNTTDADNRCCLYRGQNYKHGEVVSRYCAQFQCSNGELVPTGYIMSNCLWCQVYSSGHFLTFNQQTFNWRAKCNYTLTQLGKGHDSNLAVFVELEWCPALFQGLPGCLGTLSFKDYSGINFSIGRKKIGMIGVNEEFYALSERVKEFSGSLAWKNGRGIRILGSSGLFVEYGGGHILVGVPRSVLFSNLTGLCGSVLDKPPEASKPVEQKQMTRRDLAGLEVPKEDVRIHGEQALTEKVSSRSESNAQITVYQHHEDQNNASRNHEYKQLIQGLNDDSKSAGRRLKQSSETLDSDSAFLYHNRNSFNSRDGITNNFDAFANSWKTHLEKSSCHRINVKDRKPCSHEDPAMERDFLEQCTAELEGLATPPGRDMMHIHAANCVSDLCACMRGKERLCSRAILSNFLRMEESVHYAAHPSEGCSTGWINLDQFQFCYSNVDEKLEWREALESCKGMKSELATLHIPSASRELLSTLEALGSQYWVGATNNLVRGDREMKWSWSDSALLREDFLIQHWMAGGRDLETCLSLQSNGSLLGLPVACHTKLQYICRRPQPQPDAAAPPVLEPPCPANFHYVAGTCYYVSANKAPRDLAETICMRVRTGALASFSSSQTWDDFKAYLKTWRFSGVLKLWVSLLETTDSNTDQPWQWKGNGPVHPLVWAEGVPFSPGAHCALLDSSLGFGAVPMQCSFKSRFVCSAEPSYLLEDSKFETKSAMEASYSGCPIGWIPWPGSDPSTSCLFVARPSTTTDWTNARRSCRAFGGHLASVPDRQRLARLQRALTVVHNSKLMAGADVDNCTRACRTELGSKIGSKLVEGGVVASIVCSAEELAKCSSYFNKQSESHPGYWTSANNVAYSLPFQWLWETRDAVNASLWEVKVHENEENYVGNGVSELPANSRAGGNMTVGRHKRSDHLQYRSDSSLTRGPSFMKMTRRRRQINADEDGSLSHHQHSQVVADNFNVGFKAKFSEVSILSARTNSEGFRWSSYSFTSLNSVSNTGIFSEAEAVFQEKSLCMFLDPQFGFAPRMSPCSSKKAYVCLQENPKSRCREGFFFLGQVCYFPSTTRLSWFDGARDCASRGAALTTFSSHDTWRSLGNYIDAAAPQLRRRLWVGASDHQGNKLTLLQWGGGHPIDPSMWNIEEFNAATDDVFYTSQCVYADGSAGLTLRSSPCTDRRWFLCSYAPDAATAPPNATAGDVTSADGSYHLKTDDDVSTTKKERKDMQNDERKKRQSGSSSSPNSTLVRSSGRLFKLVDVPLTWQAATIACQRFHGYMAEFLNVTLYKEFIKKLDEIQYWPVEVWLGARNWHPLAPQLWVWENSATFLGAVGTSLPRGSAGGPVPPLCLALRWMEDRRQYEEVEEWCEKRLPVVCGLGNEQGSLAPAPACPREYLSLSNGCLSISTRVRTRLEAGRDCQWDGGRLLPAGDDGALAAQVALALGSSKAYQGQYWVAGGSCLALSVESQPSNSAAATGAHPTDVFDGERESALMEGTQESATESGVSEDRSQLQLKDGKVESYASGDGTEVRTEFEENAALTETQTTTVLLEMACNEVKPYICWNEMAATKDLNQDYFQDGLYF